MATGCYRSPQEVLQTHISHFGHPSLNPEEWIAMDHKTFLGIGHDSNAQLAGTECTSLRNPLLRSRTQTLASPPRPQGIGSLESPMMPRTKPSSPLIGSSPCRLGRACFKGKIHPVALGWGKHQQSKKLGCMFLESVGALHFFVCKPLPTKGEHLILIIVKSTC